VRGDTAAALGRTVVVACARMAWVGGWIVVLCGLSNQTTTLFVHHPAYIQSSHILAACGHTPAGWQVGRWTPTANSIHPQFKRSSTRVKPILKQPAAASTGLLQN